jgi:hypothetical protein
MMSNIWLKAMCVFIFLKACEADILTQNQSFECDTLDAAEAEQVFFLQVSQSVDDRLKESNTLCLNAQAALDFEHHRLLDWVAYHNLLGVECFFLQLDMCHSNLSNPQVLEVYNALHAMRLPLAHVIERNGEFICDFYERDPPANLVSRIRPKYLMNIDIDEFLVLDSGHCRGTQSEEVSENTPAKPSNILEFLGNATAQQTVSHMYVHRFTYGTNGYVAQPSSKESLPEFSYLQERTGNCLRTDSHIPNLPDKIPEAVIEGGKGKVLEIAPFTEQARHYIGHFIQKNLSEAIYPNGTHACESENALKHRVYYTECAPPLPSTSQPLFINHYITGSLQDCLNKAHNAHSDRRRPGSTMSGRSEAECRFYHRGTSEYEYGRQFMVNDSVLAKYGAATRIRSAEIFNVTQV